MSLGVLLLVLAAAFAHAGWNFLAKGAEGGAAFVWLCAVVGTLLWVPALAIALGTDPGDLGWTALGLMLGSGALHALHARSCSAATRPVTCRSSTRWRAARARCSPARPRSSSSASGRARSRSWARW